MLHITRRQEKDGEDLSHFITSQNIVLKSLLQHDSLGQSFVLQTGRFDVVDTFPYLLYLLELHLSLLLPQDVFLHMRHVLLKLENS